jgi:hypothetical protein
MRTVSILLASLLTLGCGMGPGDPPNGHHTVAALFSPPAITTLTPNSVPVNSVPFTMTINGSNFGTDAIVFWSNTAQSTIFVSPSQLMVAVTADDLMFWGLIPVYVRTGGMNSNTVQFNLTP